MGEEVPILFKVIVNVKIGKYFKKEISMLVASDNCILEVDLFQMVNLETIFNSVFGERNYDSVFCSKIVSTNKVPHSLEELFIRNAKDLDLTQRNILQDFYGVSKKSKSRGCFLPELKKIDR